MDLCWRNVLDVLFRGHDVTQMRCAVELSSDDCATSLAAICSAIAKSPQKGADSSLGKVCLQNDTHAMDKAQLQMWRKLSNPKGVNYDTRRIVEKAIEARDGITLRQHIRTVLHLVCVRVRIVSQEAATPRSVHFVWFSKFHQNDRVAACTHGPHANYACGTTIVATMHPSVRPWLQHIFLFYPNLQADGTLWKEEGRGLSTAVHATMTPTKLDLAKGDSNCDSPAIVLDNKEDLVRCEGCLVSYPMALVTFLEHCGHAVCHMCATACVNKHVEAPRSTTTNMPCPAYRCTSFLMPAEVRSFLSMDDYDYLEVNDVRVALEGNCAECPCCGCMYEKVCIGRDGDPLQNKYVCTSCNTDFCALCSCHPFHEGRPCREWCEGPACRYCGNPAQHFSPNTCDAEECLAKGRRSCPLTKPCGHLCCGTIGEKQCVSCLDPQCADRHKLHTADDFCSICFVETLGEAPCLQLECGHVFHVDCIEEKLRKRWPTARITFAFMNCPICGELIDHHLLTPLIAPLLKLRDDLEARFEHRMRMDNLLSQPALLDPNSRYYHKPTLWATDNLCYFMCYKCNRPYYGGLKSCMEADHDDPPREELVCGGCSCTSAITCAKHGNAFMEYKCRYCCNLAVWYCWGTTHFCDVCHSPPRRSARKECEGEETCPIGARHPPNGTEFCIGCALCRSEAAAEARK